MRRAQAQTITFPAYDSASVVGALKTGLALLVSDVKISKDGGAFVNASNAPTEIGGMGVYALTLTAAETACSWLCVMVSKTGMRPQLVEGAMSEQPNAAVVADASAIENYLKDRYNTP
jgi:hypothetical protein